MTSTIKIFEDRKDYHEYDEFSLNIENLESFKNPNPIDLWYDKKLYGRVNQQNDYIYIPTQAFESQGRLKMISDTGLYALEFVANAYADLKNKIDRIVAFSGDFAGPSIGKLSILKNLTPKRAFEKPLDYDYDAYADAFIQNFNENYLRGTSRDQKVKNFEDYVEQVLLFINETRNKLPFTKSGFISSVFCSPFSSGLMIDLSMDDHNDDFAKGIFIEDDSFDAYHTLVKQYGFYVDKNAPWRLVANISSPQMQRYWVRGSIPSSRKPEMTIDEFIAEGCKDIVNSQSGVEVQNVVENLKNRFLSGLPGIKSEKNMFPVSVEDLFNKYYQKSYNDDLNSMGRKLIDGYNNYVDSFPRIILEKDYDCFKQIYKQAGSPANWNRVISRKTIYRKKVTAEVLLTKPMDYVFRIYLNIRSKEENIKMSKSQFDNIILQAHKYYLHVDKKNLDNGNALKYINNMIKGQTQATATVLPFQVTVEGEITGQEFYGLGSTDAISSGGDPSGTY